MGACMIKKYIFSNFKRILWHINRSPFKIIIKKVLRFFKLKEVNKRKGIYKKMYIPQEIKHLATRFNQHGYVDLSESLNLELLSELAAETQCKLDKTSHAEKLNHKKFWTRLLDEDLVDGLMPVESVFVRFAMQPVLVKLVSEILNELPKLDYVLLTLSKHQSNQFSYSQLWHKDYDDVRTIKVFVYLTDVLDVEDGPFTFIPADSSERASFSLKSHRQDEDIFKSIRKSDIKMMRGKKLSAFIVETSRCLHMGSRVSKGRERVLYTATYFSSPRIYPSSKHRFNVKSLENIDYPMLIN
jgi:hypothetical protein